MQKTYSYTFFLKNWKFNCLFLFFLFCHFIKNKKNLRKMKMKLVNVASKSCNYLFFIIFHLCNYISEIIKKFQKKNINFFCLNFIKTWAKSILQKTNLEEAWNIMFLSKVLRFCNSTKFKNNSLPSTTLLVYI